MVTSARPLAHVQTWRPYTLWYVGLVGLAGAGLAGSGAAGPGWVSLAVAWLAPTVGWVGGHYLGDYFDRDLDAIDKPQRPIPSGRLPARTALRCGVGCLAAVVGLAVVGGWGTTVLAAVAVVGVVGYGRWFKARGIAGNLARGALGALVLAFGTATVGPPGWWPFAAFLLAFWAHDTVSNLVGTLRDVAGDRAGGYRTVPVRHGSSVALLVAVIGYAAAVGLAAAGGASDPAFLAVLAVAAALGAMALVPLVVGLARRRAGGSAGPVGVAGSVGPAGSAGSSAGRAAAVAGVGGPVGVAGELPARVALRGHEVLVVERIVFTGAVLVVGFGVVALVLVVPAVGVTWWTQARMRAAHEFGTPAALG